MKEDTAVNMDRSMDAWSKGWMDGWIKGIHFSIVPWLLLVLVIGPVAHSL